MTDAERAALVAALMDEDFSEFAALRAVERVAAERARIKPALQFVGTVGELREMVAMAKRKLDRT
jgi:hypothetical protein